MLILIASFGAFVFAFTGFYLLAPLLTGDGERSPLLRIAIAMLLLLAAGKILFDPGGVFPDGDRQRTPVESQNSAPSSVETPPSVRG